jgi:hypothetical protein
MAGLVPAIHVFLCAKDVDARHEAGHDAAISHRPLTRRNSTIARSNFSLNNHIASSTSRIVADVRARSALP